MPPPFVRGALPFALIALWSGCTALTNAKDLESNSDPATLDDAGIEGGLPPEAGSDEEGTADSDARTDTIANGAPATAFNLTVREVALYQAVKITLANGVTAVTERSARVVAGRPALLRVFVDPTANFEPSSVTARLTLSNPGSAPVALDKNLTVTGASKDGTLSSTFNFELSAEQIGTETEYAVTLLDGTAAKVDASAGTAGRIPQAGFLPFLAEAAGSAFRVVIIPVRYGADGSGRMPGVGTAQTKAFRDVLFSMLPTHEIEVTVGAPLDFESVITREGNGWSQLLERCVARRNADHVDAKTYYYCMFNPAADFIKYCGDGCVAGLGPVPSASDVLNRAAVGLGFGGPAATMAHELGHTLGRPHAPCGGVAGPDPAFPYPDGHIGSWGYNLLTKKLFSPEENSDLMGYCAKTWISDYNYDLILSRFQTVLTSPALQSGMVEALSVVVGADQSLRIGSTLELTALPLGVTAQVTFFDGSGSAIESQQGTFVAVSHLTGGIIYLPKPPAAAARADIQGFGSVAL